jgi:hypothetical protein
MAPMPPTGTRQAPPITWYRKQRFWTSDGSCREAKVPIRPSVATTPRTRPSSKRSASVAPSGRSASSHASPISARASPALGSGSVSVGNSRSAAAPHSA